MLEAEEDMKVVGEAADGAEAVAMACKLMPDVVLMDITMPKLDGIEATRTLHREMPHVGVVFVTMFEDDAKVIKGLQAGGPRLHSEGLRSGVDAAGGSRSGQRGVAAGAERGREGDAAVRRSGQGAIRAGGRSHSS
jgi:CheY-like chemotaxis protein